MKELLETLKMITSIIGIIYFLFQIMQKVKVIIDTVPAPKTLDFFFLFFWVLAAALVGGLLWAFAQQIFPSLRSSNICTNVPGESMITLGGANEPHGLAAFLWPIITNIPTIILLILVLHKYFLFQLKETGIISLLAILSLSLASLIFYDFPISGYRGFRCYFTAQNLSYPTLEIYMVLIWSGMLSIIPFLTLYVAGKFHLLFNVSVAIIDCMVASGLVIGLMVFCVGFFVAGYHHSIFESARGVVAGVALRISLFFGLFILIKR